MPVASLQPVTDPADERLADYVSLTDVALRSRQEPAKGLYIAESSTVLGRALAAGHRPRSVLLSPRWLPGPGAAAGRAARRRHRGPRVRRRGARARGDHRVPRPPRGARRDAPAGRSSRWPPCSPALGASPCWRTSSTTRTSGAAFRSAAALGVDAVLVTPRCADPLYRRSVRVSMGTVFQVPWTRIDPWPDGISVLREAGFVTAALALSDDSITLDELVADPPERLALVLGAEGHGLKPVTVAESDLVVRIPMAGGVDSLNVAAAAAVAFWATRLRSGSGRVVAGQRVAQEAEGPRPRLRAGVLGEHRVAAEPERHARTGTLAGGRGRRAVRRSGARRSRAPRSPTGTGDRPGGRRRPGGTRGSPTSGRRPPRRAGRRRGCARPGCSRAPARRGRSAAAAKPSRSATGSWRSMAPRARG